MILFLQRWVKVCYTLRSPECFFLLYLVALTYQQANQLSRWPGALPLSLARRVTVMEGWPVLQSGAHIRRSHGEHRGHRSWVVRLVCNTESFQLHATATATATGSFYSPEKKTLFHLSVSSSLFSLAGNRRGTQTESGWAEWCRGAQASTQSIMGRRAECTDMKRDQLLQENASFYGGGGR